jgi:hypothetical protein
VKKLKGPELKMPELKVPQLKVPPVVLDIFYDLRDRRLLPLVGLAILAIVAVPFLLGGSDSATPTAPTAGVVSTATQSGGPGVSELTVVEAQPGLRDYRKRLAGRRAVNPFKQRYTGSVVGKAKLNPQTTTSSTSTSTSTSSGTSTTTTTTTSAGSSPSTGSSPSGGAGAGNKSQPTVATFSVDVKIVRTQKDGSTGKKTRDSSIRRNVMPTTPLPGEKAPVVTYMGIDESAKKALLMVSNNVKSIFGDGKCLSGTDTCQLLRVEPGFPETFVYGANDVRYRVTVLKIEPATAGHS